MSEDIKNCIAKIEEHTKNVEEHTKKIEEGISNITKSLKKSNKLPLYWVALGLFAVLIIAGVAAFVLIFKNFNNNIAIQICSCAIICCAFICATLLLIFSFKYLYNLKKASNQTESTEILENAYIEYFQNKYTGNTATAEKTDAEKNNDTVNISKTENNNDTGDIAETKSNESGSASN